MKIVDTDNFGGDYPDEKVIAEGITNERFAKIMCRALNDSFSGETAMRFYKVVPDDYVLQPGFEP